MTARIVAIYRHPVKGFTPEALGEVALAPDRGFPHDRIYAVENGPSGFDPAAPAFVSKQKFTVLASLPRVGLARTRYDESCATLHASAPGQPALSARLDTDDGRDALAAWLTGLLGEELRGPLKVLPAPESHRFTDNLLGQVSILNMASLRDLSARMGVEVDPLRFRANVLVEGWPAWLENEWTSETLALGDGAATVFKPIVRCAATHVHPHSAERDLDVTRALFEHYGHTHCGIYVRMTSPATLRVGDLCSQPVVDLEDEEEPAWS